MNTYLIIMVTILVATQVIRITQNTISLIHQEREIKKAIGWIKDNDVSEHDFDVQRRCFYKLDRWLDVIGLKLSEEVMDEIQMESDAE